MLFSHISNNFISAQIKALKDVWIVGDIFLWEIEHRLQEMHQSVLAANKTPPYLYERYNIATFFQNPMVYDSFARIQNAMVDAFNRRHCLPGYIIMIPDKDIIDSADFFNFGVSKLLGITMNWLAKQIECMIDAHWEQIMDRRPGAMTPNLKIIWVKMIEHPPVPLNDRRYKTQATRAKFNVTIDNLADWCRDTFITSITPLNHHHNFDFVGYLRDSGKLQFWKELDHHFKKLTEMEIPH